MVVVNVTDTTTTETTTSNDNDTVKAAHTFAVSATRAAHCYFLLRFMLCMRLFTPHNIEHINYVQLVASSIDGVARLSTRHAAADAAESHPLCAASLRRFHYVCVCVVYTVG